MGLVHLSGNESPAWASHSAGFTQVSVNLEEFELSPSHATCAGMLRGSVQPFPAQWER